MKERFDFHRRVLMCENCGAPLETGFAGGRDMDEALSLWRSTCRELSSSEDYAGGELLYHLTVILSDHFSGIEVHMKERALYESALDVLTLPRDRQIMRGLLARKAARAGYKEAARKWLAPCDPRSLDLETDSTYRVSVKRAIPDGEKEEWRSGADVELKVDPKDPLRVSVIG